MCDNDASTMNRWAPLSPLDEFDITNATLPLPWIFPRGGNTEGGGPGGVNRVILRELGVLIRTLVFFLWHNNGAVAPHNFAKKHGTPTM
jgi:hypothetical protein